MARMASYLRGVALLAFALGASAQAGCYDSSSHVCDCSGTEEACTTGTWTAACDCAVPMEGVIDLGCAWATPNPRYGCAGFPHNVTGVVGDGIEVLSRGADAVILPTFEAYDACDMTSMTTAISNVEKGAEYFRMVFRTPGTYYLTASADGTCAAGLKVIVIITGEATGDNAFSSETIFAPDTTHNPGEDDDFEAFGKGVYHDKAYDDELHTACASDTFCLDRAVSKGSCYYGGDDFHIGHAVFCDVTEVECCGYMGCADQANRGKYTDGTSHGYYWYAPGYISRGSCCHCSASCDHGAENATLSRSGICTYYDVTTTSCQREPDRDSLLSTTVGFLKCEIPDGMTNADGEVREKASDVVTETVEEEEDESGASYVAPLALILGALACAL